MTVVRLAVSELRRISAGVLPVLAVVAMVVIPTLYSGLYLFANDDPYGALHRVPAALVVEDRGATSTDTAGTTSQVRYGEQVAERLLDGDAGFGWVETSRSDADEGVRSGRFDAALVIGPSFSADLLSSERYEPRQANLTLVTNDANNYLAATIAETVVGDVRDSIAEQVGTQAAEALLGGISTIRTDLSSGVEGAQELVDGTAQLAEGTVELVDGTAQLAQGAQEVAQGSTRLADGAGELASASRRLDEGSASLSSGLSTLEARTTDLPTQTRALADGAQEVASGSAEVAAAGRDAATLARQVAGDLGAARAEIEAALASLVAQGSITQEEAAEITAVLERAGGAVDETATRVEGAAGRLDELGAGSARLAAGAEALAGAAPELADGIATAAQGGAEVATGSAELADGAGTLAQDTTTLATGAGQVSDGAARLAASSVTLRDGTSRLQQGTTELADGLREGLGKIPDLDEKTQRDTARTISDPVRVDDDVIARAGSYGAGLAPFFMSLATWIGAYVLFLLVRPLSARALAYDGPAWRTALGGWVPPALVGVAQVALMFTVVRFALDIRTVHVAGTALVLLTASAAFVAVLQALNAWLGAVGQFLGLVLMLVQLVTAGGTFPWQTIPEPLRSLHRLLPMSYSVEGLRQTLFGGDLLTVARDVGVLLLVFLVAIVATTAAAHRQRVWTPSRLQPELVL
jgi:putative membrane protein